MTSKKITTPPSGRTRKTKRPHPVDAIPSPTHWVRVEDNHIPLDTWCLVSMADEDGNIDIALAYKSSKTGAWVEVGNAAIDEEATVTAYSIITDLSGHTIRV